MIIRSFECLPLWYKNVIKIHFAMCHNPIFTHGIFSGVGTQNETAQTKPAWSDESLPHQITPRRRSGTYFPKFDQVWLGLTRFDQGWASLTKGWPSRFWPKGGPLCPKTLETRSGIHFPEFGEVWPSLTRVDQVWPRLTKVWPRFDRTVDQTESWNKLTTP